MIVIVISALAILLCLVLLIYYKVKYQYWRQRNLPYIKPRIPFGNVPNPFNLKEKPGLIVRRIYDEMKMRGWKHGGFYLLTSPVYLVVDLDLVKNILTKDFHHFTDRGTYYNEADDPLSAHLFNLGGNRWKNLRAKLSPTFTSSKMKMMLPSVIHSGRNLLKMMDTEYERDRSVNITEMFASYTMSVIASSAFGLKCEEQENEYKYYAKQSLLVSKFTIIAGVVASMFPDIARKLHITMIPRRVSDFFMELVRSTVKYREGGGYECQDFMKLLIDLKKEKNFTIPEIAAQSLLFFVAGFDTSASAMTFALYELSKDVDMQDKVRREVNSVLDKHEDGITYEILSEMIFLQQVIEETLRKYPPLLYLTRKCINDYKVPNEEVVIEKDTMVVVSVQGVHHDEEYYPEPEKFDPERFNEENKASRHQYAHIPFGEGPRVCIGKRFGVMQIKIGLVFLLKNYKFYCSKKNKEPFTMKINSLITVPQDDVWVDALKISL